MKILIIEDEPGIVRFLQQGLQEEGYEVIHADTGLEGLEVAGRQSPDLILLDWMLPDMEGVEVCRKLREERNKVPVIFLTAKDTVQDTIEGLRSGANDYIKKPFNFEELLERIRVQLRSAPEIGKLNAGPIEMIPSAHKVSVHGNEVLLTQREYSLLKYLVENKGTVCTRADIIKNVWNIHFDYDSGIIDVFMNAIRKKLKVPREEEVIKTIRGIGYIIEN